MLLAALLIACAPTTLQTARTNGKGNFQFAVEPGVWKPVVNEKAVATTDAADVQLPVLPAFNISGRYGITDSIDVGLRLGTSVYEVQTKFMLTDPADTDGVALALAPSTTMLAYKVSAGGAGMSVFFWDTRLPLLVGVPVGRSELTLAPRLRPVVLGSGVSVSTGTAEDSASGLGLVMMIGGSVGFAGRAADKFRIMPEIGVDVPLFGAARASAGGTGSSDASVAYGGLIVSGNVGFMFGGPDN